MSGIGDIFTGAVSKEPTTHQQSWLLVGIFFVLTIVLFAGGWGIISKQFGMSSFGSRRRMDGSGVAPSSTATSVASAAPGTPNASSAAPAMTCGGAGAGGNYGAGIGWGQGLWNGMNTNVASSLGTMALQGSNFSANTTAYTPATMSGFTSRRGLMAAPAMNVSPSQALSLAMGS